MSIFSSIKKVTVAVVTSALLFTVVTPISAFASTNSNTVSEATYQVLPSSTAPILPVESPAKDKSGGISTQGVKSKGAIKVIGWLNSGGAKLVDLAVDANIISRATGKTLMNNSSKIAKFLNELEAAPADFANMTRSQLPRYLTDNTRMAKGTAENIAIAIAWAIRAADALLL